MRITTATAKTTNFRKNADRAECGRNRKGDTFLADDRELFSKPETEQDQALSSFAEEEAFAYLEKMGRFKGRLGAGRFSELLAAFDHPERKLRVIHVAGTNGKGSTSSYIAAMLAMCGYRVGLYMSPYYERFGERIRIIEGEEGVLRMKRKASEGEISRADAALLVQRIRRVLASFSSFGEEDISHFEFITCMAFLRFYECGCDYVVLETGLGGRLDPTNVIPPPLATAITSLSHDHAALLGETMREIAREKAGIIKTGTKLYLYDPFDALDPAEAEEVLEVMTQTAKDKGVPLRVISSSEIEECRSSVRGQDFRLRFYPRPLRLNTAASYQVQNAAMATALVTDLFPALKERGGTLAEDPVLRALAATEIRGRMEILGEDPPVILDGAHNPGAVRTLFETLSSVFPQRELCLVLGVMRDKDVKEILRQVLTQTVRKGNVLKELVCAEAKVPRALPAAELRREAELCFAEICAEEGTDGADLQISTLEERGGWRRLLHDVRERQRVLLVTGSFYLISEIKAQADGALVPESGGEG